MPLQYFGHSAIGITTAKGTQILIDPWLTGNPKCPANLKSPEKVDLIVLSHGHSDHAGEAAELAIRTKAAVCATWELSTLLAKDGVPERQLQAMNKGGTKNVAGVSVTLTHAMHSSSYVLKDGSTHYAGEPCGIVLKLESGRVIYHAGDTALFTDMKLIAERYRPEIALLPIGDCFTMGPIEAAQAVQLLEPQVVIPIHFATFPQIEMDPEIFREAVGTAAEVKIMKPGDVYKA